MLWTEVKIALQLAKRTLAIVAAERAKFLQEKNRLWQECMKRI